jgi:glycosyltransferase involved in cell wall biosynthesis
LHCPPGITSYGSALGPAGSRLIRPPPRRHRSSTAMTVDIVSPPPIPARDTVVRVASVPASHVYVRHLSTFGSRVTRLPDPIPPDGRKVPGGWWPPAMLEPGWVEQHHQQFDVFHVHFGFDALSADRLQQVVDQLRACNKPLVYTVHDLRNPHQAEAGRHEQLLDVLIPAADRLVTLTPGAADHIARRWGRHALVLPHPHVLPSKELGRRRPSRRTFTVGIHAKSARANMDPIAVIEGARHAVRELPNARLQVNVHDEVFEPANGYWYNPELAHALRGLAADPVVDLRVHPYFTDDQLWAYLADLDVSILPYRFGTHSGWLEACHDVGTAVIAPTCGHYQEQRPAFGFVLDEKQFDPDSLQSAIRLAHRAVREGTVVPAGAADRQAEKVSLDQAHHFLYSDLLR